MRRRLVISYLLLMVLVLIALETPLAATMASRETERVRADRLADATRFASLAGPALRDGGPGPIESELTSYDDLYAIGAAIVDRDRNITVSSPRWQPSPGTATVLDVALSGQQTSAPESVWPWTTDPVVVSVPINDGGEVLGAVVIVTPAGPIRRAVVAWWLLLALAGLLAVLACVLTAFGLAGWVLRPVTELDAVTHEIAEGDRGARVQHRLGPPELRRLAASFNHMADVVSDVMDRQRAFVAHASHQLRNPLTALRLRVEELGPTSPTRTVGPSTGWPWRRPTGWRWCSTRCSPSPGPNGSRTSASQWTPPRWPPPGWPRGRRWPGTGRSRCGWPRATPRRTPRPCRPPSTRRWTRSSTTR